MGRTPHYRLPFTTWVHCDLRGPVTDASSTLAHWFLRGLAMLSKTPRDEPPLESDGLAEPGFGQGVLGGLIIVIVGFGLAVALVDWVVSKL